MIARTLFVALPLAAVVSSPCAAQDEAPANLGGRIQKALGQLEGAALGAVVGEAAEAGGEPPEVAGAEPAEADGEAGEGSASKIVLELRDGTIVVGQPLTDRFVIETAYGALDVPFGDLRHAYFGLRVPEATQLEAEAAIAELKDENFKKRNAAQERLSKMGAPAAPAVAAALADPELDPETRTRLKAVAKEVAPSGFAELLEDRLRASGVTASGKFQFDAIEVDCALGQLSISLDKLRELSAVGEKTYEEGFERFRERGSGWDFSANNDTVWHVAEGKGSTGKACLWCGVKGANQYSDNAQAIATSPAIDISGLDAPELRFAYMLQMEDGVDECHLEVSGNGGDTWERRNQYSSTGGWMQQSVDISKLRSTEFRFRFVFASDGSNVGSGMHVDDFSIVEKGE